MLAEAVAALHAAAGDPGGDAAAGEVAPNPAIVVALVGMPSGRAAARAAAAGALDWGQRVEDRLDEDAVVPVRAADRDRERQAVGGDEQVVFRVALPPVGGVRAD